MERRRRKNPPAETTPLSEDRGRSSAAAPRTSYDSIAQRAYRRFEQRGGEHGRDVEDWLEAERECSDDVGKDPRETP